MQLNRTTALYLQASIVLFLFASSSAPTPIYGLYRELWGFSPVALTVAFGIYAVAVLVALLIAGRVSDHVGRRPVLLAALVVQAATMLLFAFATGLPMLLAARVVQGLATGAAVAAIGAGMLDLDRARGTVLNGVAPMAGTATGALVGGLFVQFLPAPTLLVYLVFLAIFIAQLVGVALMPETVTRRPGALASLIPHVRLPARIRGPLLRVAPALVAAWALAGFYGALGPGLLRTLTGSPSRLLGGLALAIVAAAGSATVFATRARSERWLVAYGTSAVMLGVGLTLLGVQQRSLALFFLGSALSGSGFGASFQGAIRSVVALAQPDERAGVLSILYIISYLAMGVPAVLGGVLVVHTGDIILATHVYGGAVALLAGLALAATVQPRHVAAAAI